MKNKRKPSDPKQATWKDALSEGLAEIAVWLVIGAIALLFTLIFPYDIIKEIPFEILMVFAFLIFVILFVMIFSVIHVVKTKKKTKDLQYIRKSFKGKYDLIPMTVNKKFTEKEVHLLRGKTEAGKFDLYQENDTFVFSIEYRSGTMEKRSLQTVEQAMEYIERFMQGNPISDDTNGPSKT